jgi:hypothetical protein
MCVCVYCGSCCVCSRSRCSCCGFESGCTLEPWVTNKARFPMIAGPGASKDDADESDISDRRVVLGNIPAVVVNAWDRRKTALFILRYQCCYTWDASDASATVTNASDDLVFLLLLRYSVL